MRLSSVLSLAALSPLLVVASTGGYFSEGWDPAAAPATSTSTSAAPIESTTPPAAHSTPSSSSWFDWSRLVTSGPIHDLLTRAGVNVTQHLDAARQRASEIPWDTRVPMVTDENWEAMVVNEPLSTDEEKDRTWFMVVTMGATGDPLSKYVDKEFDGAYNISLLNQDLPNVRFGRIDYLTVTRLTTRWFIWKAPILVVAHDRGRILRFFRHNEIRLTAENLHKFLLLGAWTEVPPWDGPFAPGGDLENYIDKFATWLATVYNFVSRIPKWAFLVASGSIGSLIIQAMHSWGRSKEPKPKRFIVKPASAVPVPEDVKPPTTTPEGARPAKSRSEGSPSGGRRRRNARK